MWRIMVCILTCCVLSHTVDAQVRKCDLTAEIIYPEQGHLFKSPGYDSVQINVINLGPDSLIPTDVYSIQLRFGGDIMFPDYGSFDQYVPPNGKFPFTKRFKLNHGGNVDSFKLCMEVYAVSPPGYDSLQYEKNISYDNNRVCTYADHRDSTYLGISKHAKNRWSVFPNPSSGSVAIRSGYEMNEIQVFTLLGQHVSEKSLTMHISENNRDAYIAGLRSGIYLLRVRTDNGFSTHRLVVQNDLH